MPAGQHDFQVLHEGLHLPRTADGGTGKGSRRVPAAKGKEGVTVYEADSR